MEISKIEKAVDEAFEKIIDKDYYRIYRPPGKPYVVDQIIKSNKLDKDEKKLNEFKNKFKSKVIAHVLPDHDAFNKILDKIKKDKEGKHIFTPEELRIINDYYTDIDLVRESAHL